jgi:hypothetical protein
MDTFSDYIYNEYFIIKDEKIKNKLRKYFADLKAQFQVEKGDSNKYFSKGNPQIYKYLKTNRECEEKFNDPESLYFHKFKDEKEEDLNLYEYIRDFSYDLSHFIIKKHRENQLYFNLKDKIYEIRRENNNTYKLLNDIYEYAKNNF